VYGKICKKEEKFSQWLLTNSLHKIHTIMKSIKINSGLPGFASIICIIGILILVLNCSQEIQVQVPKLINPPLPGLEPKYNEFMVDAALGGEFSLPSGTVISIPPGALVDEMGKVVSGKANLKYREMHDAASIFLSGIPMTYEKSGMKNHFTTAGMFDMKAMKDGKELFIDPDKKINVKMASFEPGNDFNFWWLDEKNQSWEFIDRKDAEINPRKEEMKKEIEKIRPALEFPLDDKYFALNYNSILDVFYKDDWEKIRNNKQKFTINKKAKAYGLTWTNIYSGADINFQGNWHRASLIVWKKLSEARIPKWLFNDKNYNSSSFTRIKGNIYKVEIEDEKGRKFTMKAEAIMPLKALFAFSPEHWKDKYEEAMARVYEEEKRLRMEADVFRTFQVSAFGVYNYDKFYKEENRIEVLANFNYDKKSDAELGGDNVIWCIPEDNKTVIKYPKTDWDKVTLLPGNKARFLTVLQGGSIAVFSAEKYTKINFDSLKSFTKPNYKFSMISSSTKILSEDDLKKVLGI